MEVIEFFLSKDFQINHAIKNNKVSGSETIYDDDFLCQNIDCKFIKSLQFIARISETAHKNDFNSKIIGCFSNYIYRDASVSDTLRKLDYLFSVFSISYTSFYGIFTITSTIVLIVCIILSIPIVFIAKYRFYLSMFNRRFWIIVLFFFFRLLLRGIT